MTGLLTLKTGSLHTGIKCGNSYMSAIDGSVIFQNNAGGIRFSTIDNWDWNVWAGLKYVHSSKTVYLGLADGTIFTTNTAQTGGTVSMVNCKVQADYYLARNTTLCTNLNANYLEGYTNMGFIHSNFSAQTGGTAYVSGDTHRMKVAEIAINTHYSSYVLLLSHEFWGHQHYSALLLHIAVTNNDNNGNISPRCAVHVMSRTGNNGNINPVYYKVENNKAYIYIEVYGGNSYGSWNTTILQNRDSITVNNASSRGNLKLTFEFNQPTANMVAANYDNYINAMGFMDGSNQNTFVRKAGDTMTGKLTTEGSLEIHLNNSTTANPMLLLHNQGVVWGNMTFRRDSIFHFVSADTSAGVDYRPLKARYYLAYTTDLCTNLNADLLDGNHENAFLRYRGATSTAGDNTLWAQVGIKEYHNVYPDGLSNGIYAYGAVVSLPSSNGRLDVWYNHHSSNYTNDGIQYRSGWGTDKKPWRMILDSVNYYNYTDGRYVNVSGDTMSGTLTMHTNGTGAYNQGIRINRIAYGNWATLTIGYVGTGTANSTGNMWLIGTPANSNSLIFNLNNAYETVGLCLKGHGNTDMRWNNNTVWHSANDGAGSGLDADLLDGLHQTSFLRTNGANEYVTLTGGSGNTAGWRLVMDAGPMGAWTINSMTLLVASRHQGTGIISLVFHTNNQEGTTYAGELRYYGSLTSMSQSTWRLFYNTSTKRLKLFWYFYDYSNCQVSILNRAGYTTNITNGTWYTSLPSDRGTELPTYYNATQYAHQLYAARTINGTSFNGTANITTSYWGTSRNFYIQDAWGNYTGAAISVNGSGNPYLKLPSTIRADSFAIPNRGGCYFKVGGGDNANEVGSTTTSNIEINSWYGVTFTTTCTGQTYTNKVAMSVNCRTGRVTANNFHAATNVTANGAITAKASSSDIRLKRDIKDFSAMEILRKIQPKQFYWNELAKSNSPALNNDYRQYGLIAQSIQNMPELEGFVDNVFKDYLIIHYEKFIPIALEGLKEVDDEVTKLKRRVEVLEKENEVLKRRIPA